MTRRKAFERDRALQQAIEVFRERGFAATSIDDLMAAMEIGRQSLYDTFGDKRGLYLEALQRYGEDSVGRFARTMQSGASPLAGLEQAMLAFAIEAAGPQGACLGVLAVAEFGAADAEVARLARAAGRAQAAALERRLALALAGGELHPGLDPAGAARFVAAVLGGIKVAGRAGADAASLQDVVRLALVALRPPAATPPGTSPARCPGSS